MPAAGHKALWTRLAPYYEVGEVLGTGATGLVVAATRKGDGREVAIKTLQPSLAHDLDLVESLEREATAGRTIRHPGIVPVLDQGWLSNGAPYVTFPRLRGESLLSLLGREQLSPREAAFVAERVARVLGAVHGAGYVHRDLKPEHVMLAPDRERLRIYVIDFGVCQGPDQSGQPGSRERGRVFGTPGYLAPEQAKGERADARSDLFGLGCVLFEMLSGRPPFPGKNPARLMYRLLCEEPPRLEPSADIPAPLCQLTHRLLARERSARPENARTVARSLAPLLGDELEVERLIALKLGHSPAAGTTPTRRLAPPSVQRILAAES
jgi:serine/threonine protein kinase